MKRLANYFDYAAATPLLPEVIVAMQPFLNDDFYNPSAIYLGARKNRLALEAARSDIAQALGARPAEIIFTAGGTEANNLAIRGTLDAYPGATVAVSAIEHESVLEPASLYQCSTIPVNKQAIIEPSHLNNFITDNTALISIMYANNEVGSIQPIREASQTIKEIKTDRHKRGVKLPLYFHVDACQAVNYLDIHVDKLGVDLMTINSGKIYGPKQCGALYIKTGVKIKPQVLGGGQEFGLRSGTQNLANIAGFATALKIVRSDYRQEAKRLQKLQTQFLNNLKTLLPNAVLNGPLGYSRLCNNVNLTFISQDNERLVMMLDEHGYQLATGSACNASSGKASHTLQAIGLSQKTTASTIRITFGRFTSAQSVTNLATELAKVVAKK